MAWLLRFSPRFPDRARSEGSAEHELAEREITVELIMSRLWDLGTTGLYRSPEGEIVAGFETEAAARSAGRRIGDGQSWDASMVIEPAPSPDHRDDDEPVVVEVAGHGHRFHLLIGAAGVFGHGGHPTTRLALDLLLGTPLRGRRVLDVGTGTGILAIAAAKAGAGAVTAIDTDPMVVAVASRNGNRNGVTVACGTETISELLTDWTEAPAAVDRESGGQPIAGRRFDVVVCNVLLSAHRDLAPQLRAAVAPGGVVITAGYLAEQSGQLVTIYCEGPAATASPVGSGDVLPPPAALVVEHERTEGDWSAHRFGTADRRIG